MLNLNGRVARLEAASHGQQGRCGRCGGHHAPDLMRVMALARGSEAPPACGCGCCRPFLEALAEFARQGQEEAAA